MIKVLIADDHHLVRKSIARLLDAEAEVQIVGEADTGEEALNQVRHLKPDVVLMDIRMPGIGGVEATRRLMRNTPDIKVIILAAHIEESIAHRLIEVGAMGFLDKGCEPDEMVSAISDVFHGKRYLGSEIAQRLALSRFEPSANPFDQLTHRELQVATMIVNKHKPSDIADRMFLSPKTVNTYRYRTFEKLGVKSDVELTHLGIRHGLVEGFELAK